MTQDEIIYMAREAGAIPGRRMLNETNAVSFDSHESLERFAALVAAHEREACAKLMDDMAAQDKVTNYYKVAANAIRARSNQ